MNIIPFNGKKVDFVAWEEKFLAGARHKGYKDVIFGQVTIPKDDVVLSLGKEEDNKKVSGPEKRMSMPTVISYWQSIPLQVWEKWHSTLFATQ
jgi:hypothetical protein